MNNQIIFIAPASGQRINAKKFLGYKPGGEGGGINIDAFEYFERRPYYPFDDNAECLALHPVQNNTWGTKWTQAMRYDLEDRAQMFQIKNYLKRHPLTWEEYERLMDLAASGPLCRREIDERLEKLGLVEEYDPSYSTGACECTKLFLDQAYGAYENIPYDGDIKLPYIDSHGVAHNNA